ncbi:MAG: hypothetical protein DRO87_11255 [Candidatus Thorarchaeota archaeon]|nr:MAG: hypothetical protein DRO87_11255 [Candidatus Thorarchaeota archaeon]
MNDHDVEIIKAIELECEVRGLRSMADHTWNLTLNIPEYALDQTKVLTGWLQDLVKVVIANEQ